MAHRLFRRAALFIPVLLALAAGPAARAETVFNRGNGTEPETLDIHKSTGVPEAAIQMDLFEGLLAPGADGKPAPGVAEHWTISADGLTYTFFLRADARWSDGTPVTADDFVFSWRRLVDPATGSDYAYFLWPVVNAEAISKGGIRDTAELGVRAVDAGTFEVRLRSPTPYFLAAMVHHSTYPISRANFEKFGTGYTGPGRLVGNGAYVLAEHVPQSHIALVRNPHFHAAAEVRIDRVVYFPTEDQNTEFKRFRAGELDVTYEVPNQQIPQIRQSLGDQLHISPYFGTYYFACNLTHEPWKSDVRLREALALAIDRDILVGKILQGGEIPAYGFVPPGTMNYRNQTLPMAALSQADRDRRARELMAQAGYGPGGKKLDVELLYNTSENHKKLAIAVATMWKQKLGIEATPVNQEWKVFLATRDEKQFKDLARNGWIGDYNDANNFLELLRGDIGKQNPAAYDNPAYDALMRKAAATADPAARAAILEEAERTMLADFPIIPVFFYTKLHLVAKPVRGWVDNIQDHHLTRYLSLQR